MRQIPLPPLQCIDIPRKSKHSIGYKIKKWIIYAKKPQQGVKKWDKFHVLLGNVELPQKICLWSLLKARRSHKQIFYKCYYNLWKSNILLFCVRRGGRERTSRPPRSHAGVKGYPFASIITIEVYDCAGLLLLSHWWALWQFTIRNPPVKVVQSLQPWQGGFLWVC